MKCFRYPKYCRRRWRPPRGSPATRRFPFGRRSWRSIAACNCRCAMASHSRSRPITAWSRPRTAARACWRSTKSGSRISRAGETRSVEQARRVVHGRALDCQHLQFRHDAAIGRETAGLVAGRQHAVARHHDRTGVATERLADVARQLDAAELFGNIAIGHGLAWRNGARDVVDAAVEFGNAVEVEHDVGKVVRLAGQQFDHALDRGLNVLWRRRLGNVAMALVQPGAGFLLVAHRQLYRDDAARAPHDAAAADRGVEYRKLMVVHVSLLAPISRA